MLVKGLESACEALKKSIMGDFIDAKRQIDGRAAAAEQVAAHEQNLGMAEQQVHPFSFEGPCFLPFWVVQ